MFKIHTLEQISQMLQKVFVKKTVEKNKNIQIGNNQKFKY